MLSLSFLPWELARFLLISSVLNASRVSGGPAVNVALQASFNSPPYLLELLLVTTRNFPRIRHGS